MTTAPAIVVTVEMAGDLDTAKRWLRKLCYAEGRCVTVTPTTFIYTGGEETGFRIGLVNYPRFPSTLLELETFAMVIARGLLIECCQKTALVTTPETAFFLPLDPPGRRTT